MKLVKRICLYFGHFKLYMRKHRLKKEFDLTKVMDKPKEHIELEKGQEN